MVKLWYKVTRRKFIMVKIMLFPVHNPLVSVIRIFLWAKHSFQHVFELHRGKFHDKNLVVMDRSLWVTVDTLTGDGLNWTL